MLGAKWGGKEPSCDLISLIQLTLSRIFIDEELNLVLLQLVQYLGHANPIVSGVAFNEVCAILMALGLFLIS